MKPICFYHRSDLDGVCSAAIVKKFVPDVELVGMDYGEPFPWDRAIPEMKDLCIVDQHIGANPELHNLRQVYMVDFSLPVEYMKSLAACADLVWIDHHKTAIEAMRGVPVVGLRDTRLAACELCWDWFEDFSFDGVKLRDTLPSLDGSGIVVDPFESETEAPEAVCLLGAYDSWRKNDPEWDSKILPFQYGMRAQEGAYDPESELWPRVMDPTDEDIERGYMVEYGEMILRYQAEVNHKACEAGAHEFVWTMPDPELQPWVETDKDGKQVLVQPCGMKFKVVDGKCERVPNNVMPSFRVLACNTTTNNSQFFDGFFDPAKHDVMCAYSQRSDGKWKVSMYTTKDEIDCGAIAKAFGGGGHKGAAGFMCDKLPWGA